MVLLIDIEVIILEVSDSWDENVCAGVTDTDNRYWQHKWCNFYLQSFEMPCLCKFYSIYAHFKNDLVTS